LYWQLGHDVLGNVCHGYCYQPTEERYLGFTIYGQFLSLSGDGKLDFPVAAKGALRFLGPTVISAVWNSIVNIETRGEQDAHDLLRSRVGGYLHDLKDKQRLRADIYMKP
jgi:hypothetical protein